jgi:O-acetyl-ADP-ribose deacetylase (regulator of RNase III)
MPLKLVRNDITKMHVNAIVNAANTALQMGGGVCGAIFAAAGAEQLQEECNQIGGCRTGEAAITRGYQLPARYIIHTVGPVWQDGTAQEAKLLRSCYINSLELAVRKKCRSIAFPLIASGIYGYPKDQALNEAISAIGDFLLNHEDLLVYLVVFDKKAFVLSEKLFSSIEKYIDDNYVDERQSLDRHRRISNFELEPDFKESSFMFLDAPAVYSTRAPKQEQAAERTLDDIISNLDETFSQMLLRLIDEKDMTDVEAYKRANMDRKLFSKIRSNPAYNPRKSTAIAFAIALGLNLDETLDLLGRAGYTLSHSNKFDVIIEYFINEENYNIHQINEVLFAFDQSLLGGQA